jgi:multidrug efflux pump subunit AcrA (membrane-fusion protein)
MNTAASLVLALITVTAPPTVPTAPPGVVVLKNCLVTAFDEVQVPGREQGVLVALNPQTSLEGTEVKKGDQLGEIDSEDLLAKEETAVLEIAVAKAQAESQAELQAAIKTKEVAEAELKSAEDANRRSPGAISENEIRRLRLTVERSSFEIELRRVELGNYARTARIKEAQLRAVRVELSRRKIVSPLDGVVVERLKHEGEWVQPGESVLKIVRLDRLRVTGSVSADQYSPQQMAGAKVRVTVEMPGGGQETAEGVIQFVNPEVSISGDYRIWTEIENRRANDFWVFRPGTTAAMEVILSPNDRNNIRPVSTVNPRGN